MRPDVDLQPPPSDVQIGMVLLLLGHSADIHRRLHRLREILERIGSRQDFHRAALRVGTLFDVPTVSELRE